MDTLTMINEAINNPEQQYETDCGKVHYIEGVLKWVDSRCVFSINHRTLKLKWRKAPEPVEFMTALRAYNDGKTIICKSGSNKSVYSRKHSYFGLVDDDKNAIVPVEILDGEWYIED